jgi:hypothetical protein
VRAPDKSSSPNFGFLYNSSSWWTSRLCLNTLTALYLIRLLVIMTDSYGDEEASVYRQASPGANNEKEE